MKILPSMKFQTKNHEISLCEYSLFVILRVLTFVHIVHCTKYIRTLLHPNLLNYHYQTLCDNSATWQYSTIIFKQFFRSVQ